MNILIACERSARVREAFIALGHNAVSCDLLPSDIPGPHLQCDVRRVLSIGWDMLIAFPDCTYLTNAGVRWLYNRDGSKNLERWLKMELAAAFFEELRTCGIPRVVLENPIMHKYARNLIGEKYTQIVHPWWFGDDASKSTCLWIAGEGMEPLEATKPLVKARYANQTPSGQNNLGPSKDRAKLRGTTYPGVAWAMAEKWGAAA